jgi:hypothetical protein
MVLIKEYLSHELPVLSHELPVLSHELPVLSHELPVHEYYSMAFRHQLKSLKHHCHVEWMCREMQE